MAEWKIPLSDFTFDREEIAAVVNVLESGWLTMGSQTKSFEEEFAAAHEVPYAIAVSSCTAALHIACLALDLKSGDEIIVPSLTFVASANAIRYTGATPVFADIKSLTDLTIDPESIRKKITEKTKAIMIMHYGGYPCQIEEIKEIAREHNLYIIEDSAHAVGTEINGKYLGTWGDIGCYSFFSNKNLVTGEGGMVVTSDLKLAKQTRLLRSHGMTTLTWDRHRGHASSYDVVSLGYNYRIDEIRAVIGRGQLKRLNKNNLARRKLVDYYKKQITEKLPGIIIPFSKNDDPVNPHLMPIILPEEVSRPAVIEQLKNNGVQTSIHYPPIHLFTDFQESSQKTSLPITENAAQSELTLPLFPNLNESQIDYVIDQLGIAITKIRNKD